VALVEEL